MIANAERIKESAQILKVVQSYFVDLKREGANWKGCCPFHNEHTPSFVVSESKGLATCFGGCARSWTPVDFIMQKDGLSYPEALVKLGGIMGVPIEYDDKRKSPEQLEAEAKKRERRESLYILNKTVWKYWQQCSPNPFPAIFSDVATKEAHLDVWGRTYKESTVKRFGLTVAPADNAIVKTHKQAGWSHENLLHLSLIKPSEKGGAEYDTFRNRLVFPIFHNDKPDFPAGFAGRIHPDDADGKRPKYLNSSESDLYHKRKVLFGLPQNRTAITKAGLNGLAYLVEGYTDVLTMADHGIENVVGKCGTALTDEQAAMLKRYAKEVIVMGDGDAAGQKAALSDVETLVKAGLNVKVLVLKSPDGAKVDPDSFIRAYGVSGFLALVEHPSEGPQDGILWRIRHELGDKPDVHRREMALDKAAEILSHLSSFKRNDYVKTLSKVSYFNCKPSEIEGKILDKETNREKHSGDWRELTGEQERDVYKYGVYAGKPGPRRSEVYLKNPEFPEPLTNFIFKPIYHIYSSSNPGRKVEIINEEGTSYILTLPTDRFTSLDKMQAEVAAYGNFIFTGNCRKADFINIIRRLYDQMETVFGISMLGWHNAGFYTFSNGVALPNGDFKPCNETGRINHDERNFVVPGFDVEEKQKAYSDEGHNVDAHIKLFAYFPGDTFTIDEWIAAMVKVYGDKGRVLVAWYLAAIYRDLIFPELHKGFPILFCFGPPQKGKSTAIWSLNAMFGKPRPPLNVNNVTSYGMSVRHTQSRNAIVSVTEYKNNVEMFKIEILKSQYDGVGRERGSTEKRNSSEQTPVNNAVTIDGQNLPLKDTALYTRCVPLEFNGYDNNPEVMEMYQRLVKEQDSGRLSQITSGLMKYRGQVADRLARNLDAAMGEVRQWVGDIKEDRILINHCILLAVVRSLEDVIAFPERAYAKGISFYEALKGWCCESIKRQFANLDAESETGDFFRAVVNLTLRAQIRHGVHIIVQEGTSVAVWDEYSGKTLENDKTTFASPHKFLFFNLDRVQAVYAKDYKERTSQVAMSVTELKSYLEQAKGFLGVVKAKKFPRDNSTLSAYVFDLGEIQPDDTLKGGLSAQGVDLPLSKIIIARENEAQSATGDMNGTAPGVLSDAEVEEVFGKK